VVSVQTNRPPLEAIREQLIAGRPEAALAAAQRHLPTLRGRDAAAAWMAVGTIHRAAGRHNLASEAFTEVRRSGGPLTAWGAWYEAEQDLARGRPAVAARECTLYLERYEEGYHREDCEQLIAFALAEQGREDDAIEAAEAWDESHEHAPIGEQVRLRLAEQLAKTQPVRAASLLRSLYTSFEAPLTGRRAQRGLRRLRQAGIASAEEPNDLPSLRTRAESLRISGQLREAWRAFQDLAARASDLPSLARWVDDRRSAFAWRAREWDVLEDHYQQAYAEDADADVAWYAYRAAARGGRYARAKSWIDIGLSEHASHRRWRRNTEAIARTLLVGRDYGAAATVFDELAERGGHTGRRNALYAAFSRWRAGHDAEAIRGFDALIEEGRGLETESRYWRARVYGPSPEGDVDRAWVREHAPGSWYDMLLQRAENQDAARRDGAWPHARPPTPVAQTMPRGSLHGAVSAGPLADAQPAAARATLSLTWPHTASVAPAHAAMYDLVPALVRPATDDASTSVPVDYPSGPFHAPAQTAEIVDEITGRYGAKVPDLRTAQDLARVGLYDLSGPLMNHVYKAWNDRLRARDPVAREMSRRLESQDWRGLFLFTRDHHHTARHTYSIHTRLPADIDPSSTRQLQHPLAHRQPVWHHAERHGLDPYLVLGLMQAESIFDAQAVSRVGARGPMQVMPRTGHLLADLADDTAFTAGALHDPVTAISYGIRYLGLLMERFDGAFPLAVASYNGGPHNVSSWLDGTGRDMPMDLWVEHIPFGETRRYVRKVTTKYASYARTWEPSTPEPALPSPPWADDANVVNF
jgi:hypothetical protein